MQPPVTTFNTKKRTTAAIAASPPAPSSDPPFPGGGRARATAVRGDGPDVGAGEPSTSVSARTRRRVLTPSHCVPPPQRR